MKTNKKGNCDVDVQTETQGGMILMGGGTDVDEAFQQQISKKKFY